MANTATRYRVYDDEGTLLYVGATRNLGHRIYEHEWMPRWKKAARIEVDHFDSMADALRAEYQAYINYDPPWNQNKPGTVERGSALYMHTYRVLRDFIEEKQYAPSVDELRQLLGLRSLAATKRRLDMLEELGLIERVGPRAIRIIQDA